MKLHNYFFDSLNQYVELYEVRKIYCRYKNQ